MRGLYIVGALHSLNVSLCTKFSSRAVQTQPRIVTLRDCKCSWSPGANEFSFPNAQSDKVRFRDRISAPRDLSSQRLTSGNLLFSRQSCIDFRFVAKRKIFACGSRDFTGIGRKKAVAKTKTHWVCEDCGESYTQWWGQCRNCKAMNSMKEFKEHTGNAGKRGGAGARAVENLVLSQANGTVKKSPRAGGRAWLESVGGGPQRLSDVAAGHSQLHWRLPLQGDTGQEIGRVLGGGLVPGSLILVGGDPGVGKSTLLLQVAGLIAKGTDEQGPGPVLYVSGEESVEQISNRADRLNITAHELFLYSATDLELVIGSITEIQPRAVIVDSIQTVYLAEANGSAGSVSQVRECATALLRAAKETKIPIFLVGHVTKGGDIAGPKILEHVVDVVLYMEGERLQSHRLLRVVKNRYGSTDEVGVFEMVQEGLAAVASPSELFLSARNENLTNAASAAVAVTMEGSRPILLEVQALTSSVGQQPGRRTANGVDAQRLSLLLAVLVKQASLRLSNQDVFINVVGGLQLREPAADVAIAVAICSSYFEKAVDREMAFIGEIGLGGELRSVGQMERRLLEAAKLGFKKCVVPRSAAKTLKGLAGAAFVTIPCADIKEVIEKLFLRN
ncbi:uncharacterized protein [Physcomitrium patens]|uniref:RecA family profile 1 domain-containing protein n=1 Tax=Physcomitrium patens TaxID=3218 RepID=A0A2K1LB73_PHYPA|nr:uncharacterized protein LOC112285994 isoform X2 [Physcomitrium patens]PNR63285.1 hypothetical protein PHYPA_001710 [Physcomitrium patens]|eukprot:XP_024383234.1 uncharacterized protein LOC112285994 isoform X2 [Physcomitrella patens]